MSFSKILMDAVNSIISTLAILYVSYKIVGSKEKFINKKSLIILILFCLEAYFIRYIVGKQFTLFVNVTLLLIVNFYLYKGISKIKIVISSIFPWIIFVLSEIFITLLLVSILNITVEQVVEKYGDNLFLATLTTGLPVLFVSIKNIKNAVTNKVKQLEPVQTKLLLYIILAFFLACTIIAAITTFNYSPVVMIFLDLILMVIMLGFGGLILYQNYNDYKMELELKALVSTLEEYEKAINIQRKANHDSKNELLIIQSLSLPENKELKTYLSELLNEKYCEDEKLSFQIINIPTRGLRGLIYSKLLVMKEKGIKYSILTSNEVNTIDTNKISSKTYSQLLKIVAIFLDNAIEATENLEDKNIMIDFHVENGKPALKISNNYVGNIDLSKINDVGYSTKGEGRGYGLSIVKEIIERNPLFINDREINGKVFSQILKIKM